MNLSLEIQNQIRKFAKDCVLDKVILFGSRARGTNRERSDIDLAVSGENVLRFEELLEEQADTLLSFDVVNLDEIVSDKLRTSIDREGQLLYAKV
ncbi:MAG: nucleotidyltransferase domain-containing protein [Fibrobacter sp.]|jgi:predicted nucleotidyltransferase|nr:nucleotidyltransferase domain-containing protein [Fibrobacter sp.]MBR2090063.1 nucleotidyltransferase domain-containing protein [Fibrobacter sp.]